LEINHEGTKTQRKITLLSPLNQTVTLSRPLFGRPLEECGVSTCETLVY
jgi:hypothetical protein